MATLLETLAETAPRAHARVIAAFAAFRGSFSRARTRRPATFATFRGRRGQSLVIPALSRDPPFLLEPSKAGSPRIKSGV